MMDAVLRYPRMREVDRLDWCVAAESSERVVHRWADRDALVVAPWWVAWLYRWLRHKLRVAWMNEWALRELFWLNIPEPKASWPVRKKWK